MKVGELIDVLGKLNPNLELHFTHNGRRLKKINRVSTLVNQFSTIVLLETYTKRSNERFGDVDSQDIRLNATDFEIWWIDPN
tara:strand:- start:22262 stop:22507 length:246 start_codon:yes stop_codon:yes gene_type:complete